MQVRLNFTDHSELIELPATSAAEIERIFRQLRYKGHRATVKAILSQYKATKPGFYQAWILLTEYPDYYLESVEIILETEKDRASVYGTVQTITG